MIASNGLCSALVCSCDKYEDAWFPFFELVKKYWANCPFKFYLNTETKHYSHDSVALQVLNSNYSEERKKERISSAKKEPWGSRLLSCLERIDTPYVIFLLEDFFLQDHVDNEEILECLKRMENDKKIACFNFFKGWGYSDISPQYPRYFEMVENKLFKVNCLAALWRKNDLISLIHPDDSPWSFEAYGWTRISPDQRFFCSTSATLGDMDNAVFPILLRRQLGYGIYQGRWLWNNDKLLKRNSIKLNYRIRLKRMSRLGCFLFSWQYKIREQCYNILKRYDKKNRFLNLYYRFKKHIR